VTVEKARKAEIIEKLKAKADRAGILVVTDFKGLKVEELTDLRVKLRGSGVDYQVVKNTLARRAVTGGRHEVLKNHLKENCAIAIGYDDPVVAAKVLIEYAKTNKKFALRFASLEGSFLSEQSVRELAKLPGKQELLGKALGTMNAVPTNFVCLFANVIRGVMNCLNALKEQKESAA
jgi:large subunit ribosomal protein L10